MGTKVIFKDEIELYAHSDKQPAYLQYLKVESPALFFTADVDVRH